MKPFSLLIKPSSWGCNLRCKYCFYLEKQGMYRQPFPRMSDEVLQTMIRSFLNVEMPVHSFGWQGGEPTTMGLEFFRQAVRYQQQFGRGGQMVSNGLQTNGTLLDDEWCKFLAEYKFLVGISIDGPAEVHDLSRLTVDGRGSHALVINGLAALKRHQVEFNVLTLVTAANQDRPLQTYHYLKELGVNFHQYIECVEFAPDGSLQPWAVRPEKWGEFLCTVFDEWYKNDTRTVSVRLFDSILVRMVDGVPNTCTMGSDCRQYFVVEHNGDIYPCDFYVRPEWKLGNLLNDDWQTLQQSELYAEFGARKRHWSEQCAQCRFLNFCAGCCPKNRPMQGADPRQLSVLCSGWKMFFEHTMPRFSRLASEIVRERRMQEERRRIPGDASPPPGKIGRNDPCPCGSGRKYKKCCGQ